MKQDRSSIGISGSNKADILRSELLQRLNAATNSNSIKSSRITTTNKRSGMTIDTNIR